MTAFKIASFPCFGQALIHLRCSAVDRTGKVQTKIASTNDSDMLGRLDEMSTEIKRDKKKSVDCI